MNAAQITLFVQHFRFISKKSYKNESFLRRFKYFWYVLAYNEGKQEFLDLMMEENFGRFLGKMS